MSARVLSHDRLPGQLLRVAPAVAPVAVLSGFALIGGLATSLGLGISGSGRGPTLAAYRSVLTHPGFWSSYSFSLWIAIAASGLAILGASLIGFHWARHPGRRRRLQLWVFRLNLSLPHLVWAVALAATFSQSGFVARVVARLGLIHRPGQFPLLVNDRYGISIIAHLVSKEIPFLALASIPLLGRRLDGQLRQAATLGATPRNQFRLVYLPAVAPVLAPAGLVTFAFALGAYDPAIVLGVQQPRTLAVVALDRFRHPDLALRAEAFALSTILAATTIFAAIITWSLVRRAAPVGLGVRRHQVVMAHP